MTGYRLTCILSLIALALLISGEVAPPARAGAWSTTDLRSGAPLPSGTVTVNHVTVAWQIGNYWSNGPRIYGLLCIPTSLPAPYPVAVLNHRLSWVQTGPFQYYYPAIEAYGWIGCTNMAGNGWLTAITTYRGEMIGAASNSGFPSPYTNFNATSDGQLELCLGEVDDVLNLLSAVTALPIANSKQVLMWGHSLGSCVTERAVERGAPVQVAVSLDGPTDFTTWTNNDRILAPTVAAQNARSSAWSVNNPAALANVKFLRIQAEGDQTVAPDQACELASKLPGSANYYLYSIISPPGVYWGSPKECSAFSMAGGRGSSFLMRWRAGNGPPQHCWYIAVSIMRRSAPRPGRSSGASSTPWPTAKAGPRRSQCSTRRSKTDRLIGRLAGVDHFRARWPKLNGRNAGR